MKIKRALISVSDKSGVAQFARGLASLGIEIISTGNTAATLVKNGIKTVEMSDFTGFPEILDGRLKTLHPLVHGGILGIRDNKKHRKEMGDNKIRPIDMVVVNLYPFEETIAKSGCSLEDAVENIDIGGPAMIRAAAKNYKYVTVVVDPADYEPVLSELKKGKGELGEGLRFRLAQKVFEVMARYDSAICGYLSSFEHPLPDPLPSRERERETSFFSSRERVGKKSTILPPPLWGRVEERGEFPPTLTLTYTKLQDLRYGENPHQRGAFYSEGKIDEPCVANIKQLHGKELSYNNIMDTDAAIELVKEFDDICAVVVKHTNPCGAALSSISAADALEKAIATDPQSAFGGIIGMNRPVDSDSARIIEKTFFEVVVAPDFSEEAIQTLMKKKNIRLLRLEGLGKAERRQCLVTRKVIGGLLVQDRDIAESDLKRCKVVTKRPPTKGELSSLDFVWKVCRHVKSNAIVYGKEGRTIGIGAGQMSRIDSAKIAAEKAREPLEGAVMASDAFFPFRDVVDMAGKSGVTAIVQPGGSINDADSIKSADEYGIAMIFTGIRHFRH